MYWYSIRSAIVLSIKFALSFEHGFPLTQVWNTASPDVIVNITFDIHVEFKVIPVFPQIHEAIGRNIRCHLHIIYIGVCDSDKTLLVVEQPVELFGCQYFRRLPHRNLSILFLKIAIIPENASQNSSPVFRFRCFESACKKKWKYFWNKIRFREANAGDQYTHCQYIG